MATVELERKVPCQPYSATDQANHGARTQAPASAAAALARANPASQPLREPITTQAAASTAT